MSRIIITMSPTIFFCPLAHAPEDLQRDELSEDKQKETIQSLMDASEYDRMAKLADEAITEAVARCLHDAMLEEENSHKDLIFDY